MPKKDQRPKIVMAGATGFVGTALRRALRRKYRLVCLTRSKSAIIHRSDHTGEEWRTCDLFSLLELEKALVGADCAIYLVHSMMPSARLLQGTFADLDLIMADNFARAAQLAGLKQILYMGGLIPEMEELSPHLASRLEVEEALGSGSTPVTALRAGLVVGPGGSSFRIVVNLVKRLPVMLLPGWTQTKTQPVAIQDVVRAVTESIGNEAYFGNHYDLGGPDVMTYRDMLWRTAKAMERKRLFINIPIFSARLSKLWVSMLGGASRYLVGPLVDSLRHPMVAKDNPLLDQIKRGRIGFEESLAASLGKGGEMSPNPRDRIRKRDDQDIRKQRRVRSVQRMMLPGNRKADWVTEEYFRWLPKALGPFIKSYSPRTNAHRLSLIFKSWVLIEFTLSPQRSSPDRQLLYITGGWLANYKDNRKGRIEFREMLDRRCLIIAIHDFTPKLPWHLYRRTQAVFHLWVMRRFDRHLARIENS
ncbi:NAD(P)H-binding protein [Puniceicoccales bacterium CK1056]|uniref:NAD(P)H-binding protein n=1 Tax=Oceanipulchritudo coccoides TaxID=2706888 RepID=A0A6B2M5I7_9BACT|nr:NAD-dependent epimerase/dehydratase family protein [Oceanipulchritudo coccoides]NDV62940.1 NAD(P)H-binding protein [Oceanipulchritudo coccoides]